MPTLTTHLDGARASAGNAVKSPATLHLAFDLGNVTWLLASSPGVGAPPRVRRLPARDLASLWAELDVARRHFRLAADASVVTCYEAGRDGFWLHRALSAHGVANVVVDSASIEVNRRARQRKTDRLDATALLHRLQRYHAGEVRVWRVVRVPSVAEEDRRHLHRELARLTTDRTRCINQIKGLLAAHGTRLTSLRGALPQLAHLTQWDGTALPPGVQERLAFTYARLALIRRQRTAIVHARRTLLETSTDPSVDLVRRLLRLRGIGEVSAWLFAMELFSWRRFRNRREVAGILGLTPTLRASGQQQRETGIGKGGSALLRALATEVAWSWLRRQPTSALSQWYRTRFATGGSRTRRIGIIAMARRLMIALWRYLDTGRVPDGAMVKVRVTA